MAADANDYFQKVSRGTATTLSAPGYTIGDTSINIGSTANWEDSTGVTFAIDEIDSSGARVPGTLNVFRCVVSGATQLSDVVYVGGDANRNYAAGATTRVYQVVSSYQMNRLIDGLLVEHEQDGTHKGGMLHAVHVYTYDGTDIFIDGVDQNNAANTTTWTKPSGLKFIEVEVQAGGGGGGGCAASGGTNSAAGTSGGGGAYYTKVIPAASLASSVTITVGAGGAGGTAGANDGADGGLSSFGGHISCGGGAKGTGGTSAATVGTGNSNGGVGGTVTTGSGGHGVVGQGGGGYIRLVAGSALPLAGGSSIMGLGARPRGSSGPGLPASGYGGGGGGAIDQAAGNTARAGGDGTAGIVIVREYK